MTLKLDLLTIFGKYSKISHDGMKKHADQIFTDNPDILVVRFYYPDSLTGFYQYTAQ